MLQSRSFSWRTVNIKCVEVCVVQQNLKMKSFTLIEFIGGHIRDCLLVFVQFNLK